MAITFKRAKHLRVRDRAARLLLEELEPRRLLSSNVLTYHNDSARTGEDLTETQLTPANVNVAQFGKLFSYPVDGYVYAQPLYVSNLDLPSRGHHNVVFVATEHDSVYAFDADRNTGADALPLWHDSFINPAAGVTTMPSDDPALPQNNIYPEVGITGTPVIDDTTSTLYVVAKTREVVGGVAEHIYRLHALDITTGAEKFGGPVVISGSVPGMGSGHDDQGIVHFDALIENQRPALLLQNGVVYVGFASHGEIGSYHGWLMGYDAHNLQQVAIYNVTANGSGGGIWESGGGPASDGNGNIYVNTGNGQFDAATGSFGDSFLRLDTAGGGLTVSDYFTPYNQDYLNFNDYDLGSGGVMVLPDQSGPHPHLLIGAGKEGTVYLVNRDDLGQYHSNYDNIVQTLPFAVGLAPNGQSFDDYYGAFDTPAYFNNRVYYVGVGDVPKAFQLANGLLSTTPVSRGSTFYGYGGATVSISANGTANGIVWAIEENNYAYGPEVLHAYDANDLAHELYNSNQAGARDQPGLTNKFAVPTVANGKVYVPTQYGVAVYGLLPVYTQEVFAIGLNDEVYSLKTDANGNAVGGYTFTTSGAVLSINTAVDAAGRPVVFALGLDDQVYMQQFDSNGISLGGYSLTTPGQVKSFAVGYAATGDLELFVIGLDDQVYLQQFGTDDESLGGYTLTQPGRVKSITVSADANGSPLLFVIGLDDQVYLQRFDAKGDSLGGYGLTQPGQVQSIHVGYSAADTLILFVLRPDNQVWMQPMDAHGNSLGGYSVTQAGQVKSFTIGHTVYGDLELLAIGLNNQVYMQKFDVSGRSLGAYYLAVSGQVKAIVPGLAANGQPDFFVIGLDDQVWTERFDCNGNSTGPYTLAATGKVKTISVVR
jgi:hypothetical protein